MLNIKKLLSQMLKEFNKRKWKLAGSITGGTDTVTIPVGSTEVLVMVSLGGTVMSATAIIASLGSRFEVGGYYLSTSDFGLCNLNVSNSGMTYQIRNARYGGQDVKSSAILTVYYKTA